MTEPTSAPRSWRLQFSLRLLLLALTAFAIGFPIWYRWPFEITKHHYPGGDKMKPPIATTKSTWQRTWGGGKVRSGRSVLEGSDGRTTRKKIEHYANDKQHGTLEDYLNGKCALAGEYEHGQRTGTWSAYDADGSVKYIARWNQDRLDGLYEVYDNNGDKKEYCFAQGRLVDAKGQPIKNRLLEQLAAGAIDDPRIAKELGQLMPVGMEFVETPLKDAVSFLQDVHNIPIVLNAKTLNDAGVKTDSEVTLNLEGIDLCSALTLLVAPPARARAARPNRISSVELAFEYRYGVLYLTTAEDVRNGTDLTGVSDIRPPAGSPLARAWNEPCSFQTDEAPFDKALQSLGQPMAIGFDLSPVSSRGISVGWSVTKSLKNLPFRHVLGLVLNDFGLRCEARGDDTIVILLQE